MAEPPRATKRVKKGETEDAEAEIFNRPEVLMYQNKALASYLSSEKSENERLKSKLSELEAKNINFISCSSLIYQQLFLLNDKLVSLLKSKNVNVSSDMNLKTSNSILDISKLFASIDADKIYQNLNDVKSSIQEAGIILSSLVDSLLTSQANIDEDSSIDSISKLKEQLIESNLKNQKLENVNIGYYSEIETLKKRIEEMTEQAENNSKRMKTLELRANRYLPYVKFEGRVFNVDIPTHEWVCHTCGNEMKNTINSLNYNDLHNNLQNHNSLDEIKEEVKIKSEINHSELSDTETQIFGMKRINEALFDIIVNMKRNEVLHDQEILSSRAFNRLLRNSSQLMQAHNELMSAYEDLKKEKVELESQKEQEIISIQASHSTKISEFHTLLQNLETQMKLSEIEKEGLLRELNKIKSSDTANLESILDELKQTIDLLEKENKNLKEDYNRIILKNSEGLDIEGNQKLNSKYAVILHMIKEKSILSDRLSTLRIEYDTLSKSVVKAVDTNDNNSISENVASTISKQISDLSEELTNERNQVAESYSEMEAIFQANQELESKNKMLSQKVEYSNKRIEMLMDESFRKSRINEDTKKELTQVENNVKIKEDLIEKLQEKAKILSENLDIEKQHSTLLKQREATKDEIIKQYENEINECKRKENESKQKIKDANTQISKVYTELSERLFKMSTHYMKTGKIIDPDAYNIEDGTNQPLEESDITKLELDKYKKMVKCPEWKLRDRWVALKWKHTYWLQCIEGNISWRSRKCPQWRDKISNSDLIEFILN